MPLHVSSKYARHQEVKIALRSLWYHHIYRWPSRAPVESPLLITEINILRCTVSKKVKSYFDWMGLFQNLRHEVEEFINRLQF